MSTSVYFDVFCGISGDMTIAAFLDAGLSFDRLDRELSKLKLKGYLLKKTSVRREGIAATRFECVTKGSERGRTAKDVLSVISRSSLSKNVKDTASGIFKTIADAEAVVHGPHSTGHLHELGSIDSIIDVAGVAIALDELGIDEVFSSSVTLGRGLIKCAHGVIPSPAPATAEMLKSVPVNIKDIDAELVTPTGAGILKALSKDFGPSPAMTTERIGYGAGARVIDGMPNMLRVMIGQRSGVLACDRISVIETNIDDMSPQSFEYLFERLFALGALDVFTTNIMMKKSRPAFKLTVLSRTGDVEKLSGLIFKETTAIGLRYYTTDRFKLERKTVSVNTRFGKVSVKVSGSSDGMMTASPEYDECVRIARSKKVPLKHVYDEAKRLINA